MNNEKKVNKIMLIVALVLFVFTIAAICMFLKNRTKTPENSLILSISGEEKVIDIDSLKLTHFTGETVNGKGEKKDIDADGIKLSDVVGSSDFTEAKVIADDSYSAVVKGDESDNAWLQIEEGQARLIVLGDTDSKRNVKNVVRIEVK